MIQWFFPSILSNVLMNDYNVVGKYLLDRLIPLESIENCPEVTIDIAATTVALHSGIVTTIRQPNFGREVEMDHGFFCHRACSGG